MSLTLRLKLLWFVTLFGAILMITWSFSRITGGRLKNLRINEKAIDKEYLRERKGEFDGEISTRSEENKNQGRDGIKITSNSNYQHRKDSFDGRKNHDPAGELSALEKTDYQENGEDSMDNLRNGLHGGRRKANKGQTHDPGLVVTVEHTRRNGQKQTRMKKYVKRKRSGWKQCWKYNPASWTVTQKKPNCKVFKGFKRKHSPVKRIIYFNKTIEYTVCKKSTRRCKEQPYFSWRLKEMVERPPCCVAHVLETFKHVTGILDEANTLYFLTVGGLVGWVKNKAMPRYENDLDILVDVMHWKRFKAGLPAMAKKHGHYVRFDKHLPNFVRIYYSQMNRVFVDAWPYKTVKINGTKWVKAVSTLTWFPNPYTSIFPLRRTSYSGIPIWVPNDPEQVLDRHYGKRFAWRKTVTCKTNHRNKCTT